MQIGTEQGSPLKRNKQKWPSGPVVELGAEELQAEMQRISFCCVVPEISARGTDC
jgi:hypothetical protein